jgi:hypothetical protein
VALVSTALAVSAVSAVDPAQAVPVDSPGGHGATWLAGQLSPRGVIHNRQFDFDDYGLTADTAFALDAIGGHRKDVAKARTALSKHVSDYTTDAAFGSADVFAGAQAKLLVLAQTTGGGARAFGGHDLVSDLVGRVITSGPSRGRIEDVVDPANPFGGDTANTIGQVFTARGLLRAGEPEGQSALAYLLQQQCDAGFFRLDLPADKSAADQSCGTGDRADTDVTALAVVELAAVAKGHGRLKVALASAIRWLMRHQHANGSFGGAGPTSAANANSTGLAGWAFLTEGRCGAARDAAGWLANRQLTGSLAGTKLAGERGAVGYDNATLQAAKKNGIVVETRDKWRRATSQAAPALIALTRCTR